MTKELKARVIERYKSCLNCGSKDNLSVDHVIPKAKGGSDREDNLQVLCLGCNSVKSDGRVFSSFRNFIWESLFADIFRNEIRIRLGIQKGLINSNVENKLKPVLKGFDTRISRLQRNENYRKKSSFKHRVFIESLRIGLTINPIIKSYIKE